MSDAAGLKSDTTREELPERRLVEPQCQHAGQYAKCMAAAIAGAESFALGPRRTLAARLGRSRSGLRWPVCAVSRFAEKGERVIAPSVTPS